MTTTVGTRSLLLLRTSGVAVVSVTFGCPSRSEVDALHSAGCALWVTVTTPAEALTAHEAGADALVVQGVEAGGHRGSFDERAPGDVGLLALLQLVRAVTDLPLVATGGIATGHGIAAVLAAGGAAAQLGTAFMLTPGGSHLGGAPGGAARARAHGPHAGVHRAARPAGSRTASCASTSPTPRRAIRRCTT